MIVRAKLRSMLCIALFAGLLAGPVTAADATTGASAAGWAIGSMAQPTNFSASQNAGCEQSASEICDSYLLTATNVGAAATDGSSVNITDTLPAGVSVQAVKTGEANPGGTVSGGFDWMAHKSFPCAATELTSGSDSGRWQVACTEEETVPAGDVLQVQIEVLVSTKQTDVSALNEAEVQGGGVPGVTKTTDPAMAAAAPANLLNAPAAPFGIGYFYMSTHNANGSVDALAGDHPYSITTGYVLNTVIPAHPVANGLKYEPSQTARDVVVYLPLGLIGDPQAAAKCPEREVDSTPAQCPPTSRIGTFTLDLSGTEQGAPAVEAPVYNLMPERGYPAEFGFDFFGQEITMYAGVVRTAEGYMLRVAVPGIIEAAPNTSTIVTGALLTFFGDPAQRDGKQTAPEAFFTNPSACTSSTLDARIEADSWREPNHWASNSAAVYPGLTGCNMLQFSPSISLEPDETHVDTPSGYQVDLKVPQSPNVLADAATPDLRNATVTLPQGVSLSPSAASGPSSLVGCPAEGPEGFNAGSSNVAPNGEDLGDPYATELGEGHAGLGGNNSPYDDGLYHTAPGHCPSKSQIGTVELKTPLLSEPMTGHIYVAQPGCGGTGQAACTKTDAEDGNLYGIYLEMAGEGVIVKLKGKVHVTESGQIKSTFEENPQLPFEELKLHFSGGQRSALANPQTCGTFTTTSDLEPWSAPESGPNAKPISEFAITGCKSPTPFAPSLEAGTQKPFGGAFSPFVLTLKRNDGEQDLAGVNITMPPGVAGMLSKVPLCEEPQAAAGTCSEASRIGTAHVAAGAGSEPLWLEGRVYLTGPYDGDPFGLSIVVPAKAGPYNLGDEVVRSGISVNPVTAQVSVSTPTIPQSRDGIPFRLKEISVEINRPGFMFNPTSCEQLHLTGSVTGVMPNGTAGSTVPISEPFADTGCKNLQFKPKFSALIHAHHSKKDGEYLHVVIGSAFGQANLAKVHVTLPRQLPSRDSTLKLACSEAQFAADPAGCPAGSFVGHAVVRTPVLRKPLVGPAIFVSHGGRAFPNLDLVLQGEGVTIVNEGDTFINKKGITTSTFAAVPDVPVNRISLVLPAGPHSALAGNGDMCKHTLHMPTTLTGQNGAVITRKTKIMVEGCKAEIAVLKHRVHGAKATIILHVPSAGKLIASGKGIGRAIKRVRKKGGRVGITVHLKRHFRSRLRHGRRHHMRVHIHLKFKPRHGKTITAHVNVKLR